MDSGGSSHTSGDEFFAENFRIVVRLPSMSSRPESDTSDSDDELSAEAFCVVRRCKKPRPEPDTDQDHDGAADAGYVLTPTMAALSPLPSPRSESGARRRRQPTTRRAPTPHYTVETIFDDFKKRRGALIRALTEDEEAFFQKCDPGMQPLHLYGGTNGNWELKPPALKLRAPALPEPTPGINIWRDTMERQKWLQKVAVHCDEWLMKISGFAAKYIAATERVLLFTMLADLPSIEEILLANSDMSRCMYHIEEKSSSGPEANAVVEEEKEERSSGPDKANEVVEEQEVYHMEEQRSSGLTKANEVLEEEYDVINDDNDYCASCNSRYKANTFWICCDECGKWYHGKCVNITSSEAEHKERYECPDCYNERVGWS